MVHRNSSVPSPAAFTVRSGGQSPMRNWCETMRVPARSSRFSFASSCRVILVDRYKVTTVAPEMSAVKRSPSMKVTLFDTSASRATCREIATSLGSISIPTPLRTVLLRGENDDAAVTGAEVVDDVLSRDAGELQHFVDDRLPGRREEHVRCPGWPLREHRSAGQQYAHEETRHAGHDFSQTTSMQTVVVSRA